MTLTTRAVVASGGWPLVGHTLALLRRPLEFLASLPAQGDLVEIRVGLQRMWVVCCPDLTHRVLRDGRAFDKGGPFFDQMRIILGHGLGTCAHGPHQRQRRLLQPAFSRDRLAVYATEMSRQLDTVLGTWRDGQVIDVLAAMDEITTRVSARTLFTTHLSPQQSADLLHSLTALLEGAFLRMIMPTWLARAPLAVNRRFNRALSTADALTYGIINAYRHDGVDHGDLLSMMLAARDEHGDALTDTELRDQVFTFWLAGTETTASLLAWSLHLLGQHPQAARRVQTEVDGVLGGRVAGHDDVARLDYTTRVLTETLRLYPPGWLFTRVNTTEATLADRTLPAGTVLLYSPYLIHRRGDLYPDPDHFDPDRWLPDHTTTLPRGAVVPFGGGARRCIGDTFAMLEATLVLATITARWQLDPLPGAITRPRPRATLRPRPLHMRLRQR
ncbi:MAG: cytochrome P450 [Pseudonocardiales bacterium]|nr:cytochrome P450 [Pseudonocardiales bacterium]